MLRQYQQEIARLRAELARPEHQVQAVPAVPVPAPPPALLLSSLAEVQTDAIVEAAIAARTDAAAGPAEPAVEQASPVAAGVDAECTAGSPAAVGQWTSTEQQVLCH